MRSPEPRLRRAA
jgi:hypothetical protein